jgi:hypothetical protein
MIKEIIYKILFLEGKHWHESKSNYKNKLSNINQRKNNGKNLKLRINKQLINLMNKV